jgi:hypothetical protein
MKVGDLVKMNMGYSEPGIILELIYRDVSWGPLDYEAPPKWARILWPDHGPGLEKVRDLEIVV